MMPPLSVYMKEICRINSTERMWKPQLSQWQQLFVTHQFSACTRNVAGIRRRVVGALAVWDSPCTVWSDTINTARILNAFLDVGYPRLVSCSQSRKLVTISAHIFLIRDGDSRRSTPYQSKISGLVTRSSEDRFVGLLVWKHSCAKIAGQEWSSLRRHDDNANINKAFVSGDQFRKDTQHTTFESADPHHQQKGTDVLSVQQTCRKQQLKIQREGSFNGAKGVVKRVFHLCILLLFTFSLTTVKSSNSGILPQLLLIPSPSPWINTTKFSLLLKTRHQNHTCFGIRCWTYPSSMTGRR